MNHYLSKEEMYKYLFYLAIGIIVVLLIFCDRRANRFYKEGHEEGYEEGYDEGYNDAILYYGIDE